MKTWDEIYGNMVTAGQIVKMAADAGQTLPDWLEVEYIDLWGADEPRPDFDQLARQIEHDAAETSAAAAAMGRKGGRMVTDAKREHLRSIAAMGGRASKGKPRKA